MAITIQKQVAGAPGAHPAYNDALYIVDSTNKTQANFSYIADIYINGSSTSTRRQKKPPHPTYGTGAFNIARIIETFVSPNFDLTLTGVTQCLDSIATIQVGFGEEFGLSTSGTTVYPILSYSNTINIYPGVFDPEEFCDYDFTRYRSSTAGSQFLTSSPSNKTVYASEKEYLYAINGASGDIYYFNVITADSTGMFVLGSYKIINNYQARLNYYDRMVRCPAGWNLNDIPSADITVVSGTLPIITSSVASYTIKCTKFDGTQTIGTKSYSLDTSCERFTKYRLHFLNKLGGYDSFSFTKKSALKTDITRENYKANGSRQISTSAFSNSPSDRFSTQYSTKLEDTIKVTSDWLTSGDVAWLEELVTSPDVYVEKNGSAVPVNIITASYDRQNGEDKKLFNLTIEFKYSYKRHRQRF